MKSNRCTPEGTSERRDGSASIRRTDPSTRRTWWRRRMMSRSIRRGHGSSPTGGIGPGRAPARISPAAPTAWWGVAPLIERVGRFADLIGVDTDFALLAALRDAEGTGPLGRGILEAVEKGAEDCPRPAYILMPRSTMIPSMRLSSFMPR